MISRQRSTAELLVLLQWIYDSLSATQFQHQQAFLLYTFQPRIPLAPFLSGCCYSDLQCGGDGGDFDFCTACTCKLHPQQIQESCTQRHWRWNTSDWRSCHIPLSRSYLHSRHGGQCPSISSQSRSSQRSKRNKIIISLKEVGQSMALMKDYCFETPQHFYLRQVHKAAKWILKETVTNRPFARWRHFTATGSTIRISRGIAFLWKLGLLVNKSPGITDFKYEERYEMISGLSSKKMSSCKWPILCNLLFLPIFWCK